MLPHLTDTQARVIGCLMEKSVVTPDQYPLTLNALTSACNQKSARDPVMSLPQREVQHAARELRDKSLLHIEENFKTGMEKYKQRLCNTTFNDLQFDAAQYAIVCLLLLRGPQTPGELRAHSGGLHSFADNTAVVAALSDLVGEDNDALIMQLPRTPGRRDAEYMHQLCGPVDIRAHASPPGNITRPAARSDDSDLARRVGELEARIDALKAQMDVLLS